tara:strand:+ start:484 stop:765 length:282 start_codon:yes stop_codon:yes gene_type:complete
MKENSISLPIWLQSSSDRIVSHMNEDHSDCVSAALFAQHGLVDANARMNKLAVNGYYALSDGKLYFLEFDRVCNSAKEYKEELMKHARMYPKI